MLKDLFNTVSEFVTNQKSLAPIPLKDSPLKRKSLYWHPQEDRLLEVAKDRPDNRHRLLSVGSVIDYIVTHESDQYKTNVWIGEQKITVECRENDPEDIVDMSLRWDPLFNQLRALQDNPSLPQAAAIKLLRQRFAPFDSGSKALTAVRALRINTSDNFESVQEIDAARIGKSISKQASGAGELPEFIMVDANVYEGGTSVRYFIKVWLSVDFAKQGHVLFEPDETDIWNAIKDARMAIYAMIGKATTQGKTSLYEGEYRVG